MFVIYKATCENGKHYIGYTSEKFETRYNRHLSNSKRGSKHYFHRALNIHKFNWEVICSTKKKEDAIFLEKYYIVYFQSKVPNGYNLTNGGEGAPGLKRSKEQIEGMKNRTSIQIERSDGIIYKSITIAAKDSNTSSGNISRAIKGKCNIAGGFSWRRLDNKYFDLYKINIDKILNNKKKQYKKVIDQFGNVFKSITECALFYKTEPNQISRVCRKERPSYKGIVFNYYKEGE